MLVRGGDLMVEKPEIRSLTGLRFIAAASIAIAHFTSAPQWTLFGLPLNFAPIGMPLFFTLSGFVIHYVYSGDFAASRRNTTVDFAIARFSRIYPLFLFLLVYFALFFPLGALLVKDKLVLASFISATASWWYWNIDGIALGGLPAFDLSWSIPTEMFFYLMYALILYRITAVKSLRICALLLLLLCVLSYCILYIVYSTTDIWEAALVSAYPHFISRQANVENSFWRWLLYISPYFHILEFFGGCLACQLCLIARRQGILVLPWQREALCWSGIAWIVIAWCLMFFPQHASAVFSQEVLGFVSFLHMTFLMAPGCLLLIISLGAGNSVLGWVLSASLPVFLGEISYSIYLGHQVAANFIYVPVGFPQPVIGLVMTGFMIVVTATGLYCVIEIPAKRVLRRVLQGSQVHVMSAAVPAE
jgi:peptidoglycan/LPS O-acetylase OafA/YrhL